MTKVEKAWTQLDHALKFSKRLENGERVFVTADQIKKCADHAEPRLITKFDFRDNRPAILSDLNITILPVENGRYELVQFDGYFELPKLADHVAPLILPPPDLCTFPRSCSSEMQVIDSATASKQIQNFFSEDDVQLTIRGRLGAGEWSFRPFKGSHRIQIDGVQIEVDGGFEGSRIYLIEAKMGYPTNVIGRQLYYPYRDWLERNLGKEVIPAFLCYSNRVYYFYELHFSDPDRYDSFRVVRKTSFTFESSSTAFDLAAAVQGQRIETEPDIVFPQADDILRVMDLIDAATSPGVLRADVAKMYDFDERQSDYYVNATKYLGFTAETHGLVTQTQLGAIFSRSSPGKRAALLTEAMARRRVFRIALDEFLRTSIIPDAGFVSCLIAKYRPELRKKSTWDRRAQTVCAWINWLVNRQC